MRDARSLLLSTVHYPCVLPRSLMFSALPVRRGFVDRHREYKDVACDIPILEIQRSLEFNAKRSRVRQFFILRKLMRNIILFDNNIYKTTIILSKTLSYLLRK